MNLAFLVISNYFVFLKFIHCMGNQYVFYYEYIKHSLYKSFCKWFELAKDRVM